MSNTSNFGQRYIKYLKYEHKNRVARKFLDNPTLSKSIYSLFLLLSNLCLGLDLNL